MFPCKLKKAVERLFCGFLAALVLFVNVTAPVRATGTLAAVAGATVVATWLMACGIYPYVTEDGQSFGEWGAGQLRDLWNQYIDSFSDGQTPSGGTKETFDKISGFVTGKTIAIASALWSELRAFAQWIVSQFSVTDNQTNISLGVSYASLINERIAYLVEYVGLNGGYYYPDISLLTDYDFLSYNSDFSSPVRVSLSVLYNKVNFNGTSPITVSLYRSTVSSSGNALVFNSRGRGYLDSETETWTMDITEFPAGNPSIISAFPPDITQEPVVGNVYKYTFDYVPESFSSVTVDTTKVSVPDALPETATYGGLTVPDAISGTAPAITDVIEQGVTDRTQPLVIPTVVEIPADTEITDDGTITENPVVVTPEMALPSVADLSLPASVIAEFKTRFPFCLPWDIMSFLSALAHTAQAPVITCDIPDPFTGQTFTITVDLSPWDDVAAIVRHFESVIIAVGFALGFRRFVLIGAHS